jgi:UPF0755 protein
VSRHARRDTAGGQDGQQADDYGPPPDDGQADPGRWPPDDLTGQEFGAAGGGPRRPAGRRHARPDAQAADAEPFRWTPDGGGEPPVSYEQAPGPGRGAPGYGAGAPGHDAGAPGYGGGEAGYRGGRAAGQAGGGTGFDPGYGTRAPGYGPPGYDTDAPARRGRPGGSASPPSGFGGPSNGHGAPPASYDSPPAGYGGPGGYDSPPAGYGSPGGYDSPPAGYPGPGGYDSPPTGYPRPGGYDNPPAGYGSPGGYNSPPGGYGSPPNGNPAGYDSPPAGYDRGQPDHGGSPSGYSPDAPLRARPPWEDETAVGSLPPLPPPSFPGSGHPSGPLPPLSPPSRTASGHPSGPLPPLPPPDGAWRPPLDDPLLDESSPDLRGPDGYGDGTGAASAAPGPAGYQAYGDDPRNPHAGVAQEAPGYPDAGGWYADVDEPQAEVEEEGTFLPGLDDGKTTRRRADRGSGTASSRKRRRRGRRAVMAAGMVLVLIVVAVLGVGYTYWRKYYNPPNFPGPGTGSVVAQIKTGDTATQVGQRLVSLGVVESARAFSIAAKDSKDGRALEPGYYHLRKHMKASLAFALLLKPSSRIQTTVAIPEGFRLSQIIAKLGQATGNLKGYQQAATEVSQLGLPSFAKGSPEGYLFPATYDIQPNTPPLAVLKSMVLRFDQEAASISLPAAAAHAELTQGAVIIVASLIQAEGKRPQDLAKIARVIYNRLNAVPPMHLQLDTTVLYALHSTAGDVTIQQTKVNSPYNTYLHAGLPPGPIDSPGNAAIEAALHPATGDWTYFLTVNPTTGETLFTDSFTQFQQFQAELAKNTGK